MGEGQLRFSLTERAAGTMSCPSQGSSVLVTNENEVREILKDVHSGKNNLNWALLGYEGSSVDKLQLIGSGTGGITEMGAHLNDKVTAYGLIRVVDVVDNISTNRFVFINWMGDHVPAVTKAKVATNKSSVLEIIGHYNVEILASDTFDIKEDIILGKIQDASGTRVRVQEQQKPAQSVPKSVGGAGAKRTDVVPTANTSLVFKDEANVRSTIQDVRKDASSTNWILIGYADQKSLSLVGSGSGGLSEMASHLKANAVNYGLLRTEDKVDNSVTTKFVFVNWVGESVSPMVKGRISTHKGTINEFFEPFHLTINAEKPEELDVATLEAKLQSLKGFKN
jgi:hypothetical protein